MKNKILVIDDESKQGSPETCPSITVRGNPSKTEGCNNISETE